jgi:hypothetical protein
MPKLEQKNHGHNSWITFATTKQEGAMMQSQSEAEGLGGSWRAAAESLSSKAAEARV